MNKYKELANNTIIFTISNFASKILVFMLVPLYTSVLTLSEYGISDIIITTVNLLQPILTLTISESVLRFSIEKKENIDDIISIGLKVLVCGFIILILFTPIILKIGILNGYIIYLYLFYIITGLNNILAYFARGIDKVKEVAISGIITTFFTLLFNIIFLIIFKFRIKGYLLSMILANAISCLYLIKEVYDLKRINFKKSNKKLFIKMLRYSIPMIPNSISWWISNVSDRYILTGFCGISINGLYSVAYKIPTIITIISTIFLQAWQLSSMKEYESKDRDKFYSQGYNYYNLFLILICSLMIIFTKVMAKILFSDQFYIAWKYVPLLLLSFVFSGLASFLGTIYTASKKTNMLFYSTCLAAIVNIILNFLLVPKFQAIGAASATFISYFIVWIIRLIDIKKEINLDMKYYKIFISYLIIFIQCIVMTINLKNYLIILIILFFILILVNISDIKFLFRICIERFKKLRRE